MNSPYLTRPKRSDSSFKLVGGIACAEFTVKARSDGYRHETVSQKIVLQPYVYR